jgi:quercetin dioxygenase-like cupin family protein
MHHRRSLLLAAALAPLAGLARAQAALDPRAIAFLLPEQIPWGPVGRNGNQQAVLVGDPSKEGFYAVMNRWLPNKMSRPHSHPHDRFIMVLKGTWWMGSGTRFDPDSTVPVHAGSFITHYARGIHYDGAKAESCELLIVGQGPGTSTPA